jgi:two-component system cell cycle sensor histidine kinase/response regulator CckA
MATKSPSLNSGAWPEDFDLILTNLTMPKLTGLELAKEILQVRPGIPVLMCTGYGEQLTVDRAKALGVREVMLKPILPQQL